MVVFSFAGKKVSVGFQSTKEGWIRSVTITFLFFKFSEICFYNIFFVVLENTKRRKTDESTGKDIVLYVCTVIYIN